MAKQKRLASFDGGEVSGVTDHEYSRVANKLIENAVRRCFCAMFIIDVTPRKRRFLVDDLLKQLQAARRRGVDVRVVVSGSNDTLQILESSAIARARLDELGVPVRWAAESGRSNHSKVLLCDDRVLIGSHNWSADAFQVSTQDSVLVSSPELCNAMARSFRKAWDSYAA